MPVVTSLASYSGYGRMRVAQSASGTVRVLFFSAASTASWTTDITNKITAALATFYPTVSVSITTITDRATTGSTLTRAAYDVCMVVTDASFSNAALGTNINNFVAAGGGLVITVFACSSVAIPGFTYASYAPTVTTGASNNRTGTSTLGTITAGDALVRNVTTFDAGTARYGSQTLTLNSGASTVAFYADGGPLAVKRTIGTARTVTLNFYAPSSTVRADFWLASTHGDRLMANALMWTGKAVN